MIGIQLFELNTGQFFIIIIQRHAIDLSKPSHYRFFHIKAAFADRTRKQWNYREKNCRDKECLVAWYAYQKNVLTKIAQTGDVNAN